MSSIFKGFIFYFLPNNTSTITRIRKNLALKNGATLIQDSLVPSTCILVDQRVYPAQSQIIKLVNDLEGDKTDVSVINQTWLTDCVSKNSLLNADPYKISLHLDLSPKSKKRKIEPAHRITAEELINKPVIENNPNSETMALLEQMAKERDIQGENRFKSQAYKTAIDTLSKTPQLVDSYEKARRLPGIGDSIALKIQEISDTSGLKVLDQLQHSERNKLLKLFKGIYSVGDVFSSRFISEGMRSLEDVARRDDLTTNQKWGLKYYKEWNQRIPRKEIQFHEEYLKALMKDIDPDIELTVGGSYRRGSPTSGDIDFIITKPGVNSTSDLREIVQKLLDKMIETGYHQCSLTSLTSKWLGGCKLPISESYMAKLPSSSINSDSGDLKCRRVDFLLVPYQNKGAAFIYFTGNDDFNKKIRKLAMDHGMVLNDCGLFKKKTKKESHDDYELELIEGFDEKKIFEFLGIKWRNPKDRNIGRFERI